MSDPSCSCMARVPAVAFVSRGWAGRIWRRQRLLRSWESTTQPLVYVGLSGLRLALRSRTHVAHVRAGKLPRCRAGRLFERPDDELSFLAGRRWRFLWRSLGLGCVLGFGCVSALGLLSALGLFSAFPPAFAGASCGFFANPGPRSLQLPAGHVTLHVAPAAHWVLHSPPPHVTLHVEPGTQVVLHFPPSQLALQVAPAAQCMSHFPPEQLSVQLESLSHFMSQLPPAQDSLHVPFD